MRGLLYTFVMMLGIIGQAQTFDFACAEVVIPNLAPMITSITHDSNAAGSFHEDGSFHVLEGETYILIANTSDDKDGLTYAWDDNGHSLPGSTNFTHSHGNADNNQGVHDITVVVTDSDGATASATVRVMVTRPEPELVPITGNWVGVPSGVGRGEDFTVGSTIAGGSGDYSIRWTWAYNYSAIGAVQGANVHSNATTRTLEWAFPDDTPLNTNYYIDLRVRDNVTGANHSWRFYIRVR